MVKPSLRLLALQRRKAEQEARARRPTPPIRTRETFQERQRIEQQKREAEKRRQEEIKRIQAEAQRSFLQEKINVRGFTFTRQQLQQAREYGRRVSLGKPLVNIPGRESFDRLTRADPKFKRDVQAGIRVRIEARRLGFGKNIKEFLSLQKREQRALQKKISQKPLAERLELQRRTVKETFKELQRIKQLTPEQRKQSIRDQIEFKKAAKFQEIKERGGELTTEARRFLDKAKLRLQAQETARQEEFERRIVKPIKEEKIKTKLGKLFEQKQIKDKRLDEFLTKIEQSRFSKQGRKFAEFGSESIIGGIVGMIELIKDPRKIKDIPEGFVQRLGELRELAKTDKVAFLGALAGEALLLKGIRVGKPSIKSLKKSKINFIVEKPGRVKKTPLSKTFPEEFKFEISDVRVESFVKTELGKRGVNYNKLGKLDQDFLKGQVKAKIRSQPEIFIPKARQIALKRAKEQNLRRIVRERLEGKLNQRIVFERAGKQILQKLTPTQKLALKRFEKIKKSRLKKTEKRRIRKAVLRRLKRPLEKPVDLLSKSEKDFIISQIRARVRADPILTLTKTQKLALKKVKKKSELKRIREAILKRLKPEKITLSKKQIGKIETEVKKIVKQSPKKFIPKARQIALKRFTKLQEKKAIKRAIEKGPEKLRPSDLLSKADKEFIKGQIRTQIRSQPERFIPPIRRQALIQIQKPRIKQEAPILKVISGDLTPTQKLALKRFTKSSKKQKQINKEVQILKNKEKNIGRQIKKQEQLQKQKPKQKQRFVQKQKQFQKQKQKFRSELKTKLKQSKRQSFRVRFLLRQFQKQKDGLKIREVPGLKLKITPKVKPKLRVRAKIKPRIKERVKLISKPKAKVITKKKKIIKRIKKKRKKKVVKRKKIQAYNVFVKSRGKLIKVNKRPIFKEDARRLGSTLVDNTTARTFSIKKTSGTPQKPILLTKPFKKRKFREHRIIKGKRKKTKNTFIERGEKGRNVLIDTPGEKRGLNVAQGIKKLTTKKPKVRVKKAVKKRKVRVSKRKPVQRITRKKRVLSPKQLRALKEGREKRMRNLKKKK